MSNEQTPMNPSVSGVNQTPAKLLQPSVGTSGGVNSINMVTTPQGMQNINRTGLLKIVINYSCLVNKSTSLFHYPFCSLILQNINRTDLLNIVNTYSIKR